MEIFADKTMKTCILCGESKDPSLFSDRNRHICCACQFGLDCDQEEKDESTDWLRLAADIVGAKAIPSAIPTKRQIACAYLGV